MRTEFVSGDRGFSLLEVLVASTILTVALVSLAQLLAMAVAANAAAGNATYAALLAAQKMEDLRAATWESLERSAGEFVDHPDRAGRTFEGTSARTEFTRRWSVGPWPADPKNTLLVHVMVRSGRNDTRLVALRTRTAP